MEENALKDSAFVLRSMEIGSVGIPKIEKENKELSQDTEIFYNKNFKSILEKMIYDQMFYLATKTETPEQFLFGRGTINGLLLIKEWFEQEVNVSLSRFDKGEEGVGSSPLEE